MIAEEGAYKICNKNFRICNILKIDDKIGEFESCYATVSFGGYPNSSLKHFVK
jgi:hypothetical protein